MRTSVVLLVAIAVPAAVLLTAGDPARGQGAATCGPVFGTPVVGATYTASATVAPGGGAQAAALSLTMLDDRSSPLASRQAEAELGATPVTLSATVVAPRGAASYIAAVRVVGGEGCGGVSRLGVAQTAPPPPVPVSTPPPATTSAPASSPPAVATPAAPPIGPGLFNGGFEQGNQREAVGWERRGGELAVAALPFEGERAAVLTSSTRGTKWLQQAVTVEGGEWYEASAWARIVAGEGEAFLRIAWYASGDGSGRQLSTVTGERAGSGRWGRVTVGPARAPEGRGRRCCG